MESPDIRTALIKSFPVTPVDLPPPVASRVPIMKADFPTENYESAAPFVFGSSVKMCSSRPLPRGCSGGFACGGTLCWLAEHNELTLWEPFGNAVMTTSHMDSKIVDVCAYKMHGDKKGTVVVIVGSEAGIECFTCHVGRKEIYATASVKQGSIHSLHYISATDGVAVVLEDTTVGSVKATVSDETILLHVAGTSALVRSVGWAKSWLADSDETIAAAVDEHRHAIYVLHRQAKQYFVTLWVASENDSAPRKKHTVSMDISSKLKALKILPASPHDGFCFIVVLNDGSRIFYTSDAPTWMLDHNVTLKVRFTMEPLKESQDTRFSSNILTFYENGSTIIFDCEQMSLFVLGVTRPFSKLQPAPYDVLSQTTVPTEVVAIGRIPSSEGKILYALLSRDGLCTVINRQSESEVVMRHCLHNNDRIIDNVVECLSNQETSDILLRIIMENSVSPAAVLSALDTMTSPRYSGATVHLSPSVRALKSIVNMALAQTWNMRLSSVGPEHLDSVDGGAETMLLLLERCFGTFEERGWLNLKRRLRIAGVREFDITLDKTQIRDEYEATEVQAAYLEMLLEGAREAVTVCRLLSVAVDLQVPHQKMPSETFAMASFGEQGKRIRAELCATITSMHELAFQRLLPFAYTLPSVVQAELSIRDQLHQGLDREAVDQAIDHAAQFWQAKCLPNIVQLLQRAAKDHPLANIELLLATIKTLPKDTEPMEQLLVDMDDVANIEMKKPVVTPVGSGDKKKFRPAPLTDLEDPLKKAISLCFQNLPLSREHHYMVFRWLLRATFDDADRAERYAEIFATSTSPLLDEFAQTALSPQSNEIDAFFYANWEEKRVQDGSEMAAVAYHQLATTGEKSLACRKMLIDRAAVAYNEENTEIDRVRRLLVSQQRLLKCIETAAEIVEEQDILQGIQELAAGLKLGLFEESVLFETAATYMEFAGAEVQLSILKDEVSAEETLCARTVESYLDNPPNYDWSPVERVHHLLKDFFSDFQPGFPLYYVVSYLTVSNPTNAATWPAQFLLDEGIAPDVVFESCRRLVEDPALVLHQDFEANQAVLLVSMATILPSMTRSVQSDRFKSYVAYTETRVKRLLAAVKMGTQAVSSQDMNLLRDAEDQFANSEMVSNASMLFSAGRGTTMFF